MTVTMFISLSESRVGEEEGKGMTNGEGTQKKGKTYRRLLYASATILCPDRAWVTPFSYSFIDLSESKGS